MKINTGVTNGIDFFFFKNRSSNFFDKVLTQLKLITQTFN